MKKIIFFIFLPVIVILISVIIKENMHNKKNNNVNFDSEIVIDVYRSKEKIYYKMNLEEYVMAVVRGEMPASFELEALKAQAVAVRTYAFKKIGANNDLHPNSPVCDDFKHCMAFVDESKAKINWKDKFDEYNNKILAAVKATEGEIILYDNQPITAVFHAISSGKTENSTDVWNGQFVPYLISVESEADVNVEGYLSKVVVTKAEFKEKLNISSIDKIDYKYTEGGNVKKLIINNNAFAGTDIRTKFNLRSANFLIEFKDNDVVFNVKGYGHGVGMSQRGANEYAKIGLKYTDILHKYYSGVEIKNLENSLYYSPSLNQ